MSIANNFFGKPDGTKIFAHLKNGNELTQNALVETLELRSGVANTDLSLTSNLECNNNQIQNIANISWNGAGLQVNSSGNYFSGKETISGVPVSPWTIENSLSAVGVTMRGSVRFTATQTTGAVGNFASLRMQFLEATATPLNLSYQFKLSGATTTLTNVAGPISLVDITGLRVGNGSVFLMDYCFYQELNSRDSWFQSTITTTDSTGRLATIMLNVKIDTSIRRLQSLSLSLRPAVFGEVWNFSSGNANFNFDATS